MTKALRIGLTGGIACGKTVISDTFKELGVPIIDTDVISREVVMPKMPALNQLKAAFGEEIITATGELDRRALRLLVFSDKSGAKLKILNDIMHPAIIGRLQELYLQQSYPYVVFVVPLLFEHKLEYLCDRILVCDAKEEVQLERLTVRDKIDLNTAKAMLKSQVSRAERRQKAHDLIESDLLTIEKMRQSVVKLHEKYLYLAKQS
jgi:dephospho-CoA kinase